MAKGFWGWIYPKTWLFGRPYTHIIRDAWKAEPTSFLFLFTAVGMLVGRFIPSEAFWWFLGALFGGIVLGHLFWPTTYGLGRKKKIWAGMANPHPGPGKLLQEPHDVLIVGDDGELMPGKAFPAESRPEERHT